MELGTQIAVLEKGRVAQLASPREVYQNPASRYVATFIGSTNELPGKVVAIDENGAEVETPIGRLRGTHVPDALQVGDDAVAIFRPEHGTVSAVPPTGANKLRAVYRTELFSGSHAEQILTHQRKVYRVWHGEPLEVGQEAWITADPDKVHIFGA